MFTRRRDDVAPDVVEVEPGFRVVHVDAGPPDLAKEQLPDVVDAFADGVRDHLALARATSTRSTPTTGCRAWPATA